jgi:predicted Na+-dependent transporter
MNDNDAGNGRLGRGGWFAIAVMAAFLIWTIWYAVHSWNALAGIDISLTGWVFIVIGILLTIGLGAGLMGLVFYSSRKDYDR